MNLKYIFNKQEDYGPQASTACASLFLLLLRSIILLEIMGEGDDTIFIISSKRSGFL